MKKYFVLLSCFASLTSFADSKTKIDNLPFKTKGSSSGVVIAILDSGVDYNHKMIRDHLWANPNALARDPHGWDFKDDDAFPYDRIDNWAADLLKMIAMPKGIDQELMDKLFYSLFPGSGGHGTHVAGIAQKTSGDGLILPVRINYDLGSKEFFEQVNAAVKYAVANGARVINMSFGMFSKDFDVATLHAVDELHQTMLASTDTLFVIAAHNFNTDLVFENKPLMPASLKCPNCITVGAIDKKGELASFTNVGDGVVDVYAPGVDIKSAWPDVRGRETKELSGTSMSAPYISGMAAKIFSKCPALKAAEVRAEIEGVAESKDLIFTKQVHWSVNFKLPYSIHVKTVENKNWISFF